MINRKVRPVLLTFTWLLGLGATTAYSQVNYYFQPAAGDPEANRQWNADDNWLDPNLGNMFVPNVQFNERAIIDNGATAILNVSSPDSGESSVVTPGALAIQSGGLDIRSAGALFVTAGNGAPGSMTVGGSGVGVVMVQSGGTLEVDGTFSLLGDSANSLSVGGLSGATATLTANAAVLGGTTNLFPNAAVSTTGGVNMLGTSVYNVTATSPSASGSINAGGAVSLSGELFLDFSGFTPAGGDSWTVVEANAISGGFTSVSSNASLQPNETLITSQVDLGGGRRGLNASISEVLILEVNRNSGAATIKHTGGTTITLDGYYVGSDGGSLRSDSASWNSLTESGQLGGDWVETDQRSTNIGELKIGADATFGGDVNLGPIYDALSGDFGSSSEDLEFSYRRSSDGVEFPGIVRYVGDKVNSLVLQVDPSGAGDAYLRNTSNTTAQIDFYEILSDSDSLNVAGWASLDDQNGPGNVWLEAGDVGSGLLAEFDSEGFTTIAPGAAINLGQLYSGGSQDLQFNFLMMGESESTPGVVIYETFSPSGLPGDFNQDGIVDAIDYAVWRENIGAASLPNDNGLGVVGSAHFQLWKDSFGASAATGAVSTPEPTAALIVGALLMAFAVARSRAQAPAYLYSFIANASSGTGNGLR